MSTITDNVEVQQPDPNYRGGDWNWHIWERDPFCDKWLGFFKDTEAALAWVSTKPGNYVINNVPPASSNQRTRIDWRAAQEAKGTKRRSPKPTAKVAATPRPKPVAVPKPQPVSKEMAAAQQQAKVVLDQHRADEAAELSEGGQEK